MFYFFPFVPERKKLKKLFIKKTASIMQKIALFFLHFFAGE